MKTLKLTMIAAFVAFVMVGSSFAATNNNDNQANKNPVITYKVQVHMASELELCDTYLIVITDGDGQEIRVRPQVFVQGVQVYTFYERGPIEGFRDAKLVRLPSSHAPACNNTRLWAVPDSQKGPFLNDETYRFDLKPTTQAKPH